MTAGMAAARPAAVAISASAIPGATTARLVEPAALISRNELMIPHTVPNSPTNGAMLAVVARNVIRDSSLFISTPEARINARSTAVRLLRVGRAAAPRGLATAAGSPFGVLCFSWVVNSAYPDRNKPTSGLSPKERHTAWTSENLLLRRNTSRNLLDWRAARPNVHHL